MSTLQAFNIESRKVVADRTNLWSAAVGPQNGNYYLPRFAECSTGRHAMWHWPAFFATGYWLLYRKLWAWAAFWFIGIPVSLRIAFALLDTGSGANSSLFLTLSLLACLAVFIVPAIVANRIYYKHCNRLADKAAEHGEDLEQQLIWLSAKGGTSKAGAIVAGIAAMLVLIGTLAAVGLPAYRAISSRAAVIRPSLSALPAPSTETASQPRAFPDLIGSSLAPLRFDTDEARIAHMGWVAAATSRLKTFKPDQVGGAELLDAVAYEAIRAGLEPALILAIVERTSEFHRYAVATNGALGYMQVAPGWAKTIGDGNVSRLFHMQTNLRFGCVILRHYLDESGGDIRVALARYEDQAFTRPAASADDAFVRSVLEAKSKWPRGP